MKNAINGKRRALRLGTGIATCVSCMVFAQSALGQSLPELSNAGGASISTSGNTLTVDALAADKVINWGTFSVAAGNTVNYVSTDGMGAAVATPVTVINRVIGKDVAGTTTFFPSVIDGRLTSTGNIAVWLINPSGVMFGPTGSFNGGSLVLSTLDFASGTGSQVFGAGDRVSALNSRDVVIDAASALGAVELKLEAGAGNFASSGSVLLLGEQVTVGKSLVSQGDVYIVAASDVRITSQAGSPVGYSFAAGTRLNGAQVLASGNVQGRSIVVAASNGTSTIANLLQVDAGGSLTATADGGSVTLLTASHPVSPATAAGASIVSQGNLRTLGLDSDVTVTSNANALVARIDATGDIVVRSGAGATDTLSAGTVQAGGIVDLRSTGDMTLGLAAVDTIQAGGTVSLRSSAAIARGMSSGTLAVRSHTDTGAVDGAMFIQSAGDANLGNATLAAGSAGTAALTVISNSGSITLGSAVAARFSAAAATTFASTGSITADNSAVAGAGTALSISAPSGITLNTARTLGADQDISLGTTGALVASSVVASRNLTIGNSVTSALSIDATTLTAQNGTITAIADDITIGSAIAGLSVNLRSDGDVEVTNAATTGDNQPAGNFAVSGLTGSHAASFTAGTVNAKTGTVSILADTQTITSVRASGNATLNGTAGITLGSSDVGGNLTVTTAGDIALGTTGAQSILADGRITITSSLGAIGRGAASTALSIRANDADALATNTLSITAQNAVALGNASLFGGTTGTAPVTVESVSAAVTMGTSRASRFTGKAATTFTAGGSILADSGTAAVGNTISITGLTGLDLKTVRTDGTGENIVLVSNGPITATTLDARNNLTVASLANPATSLTAATLTARLGTINAFAQAMALGSANAAQALTLRSDGAISVTGAAIGGTNLSVSGITGTRAASFTAGTAQATTGNVDIKAVASDIGVTTAGQNVVINGTDATLGRVTAGTEPGTGSYTVVATGAVTLGKAAGQTQSARGGITISAASISEGASGLVLTSDSDGNGTSALSLTGTGAIALANTTLNGGVDKQSAVSLSSGTSTAIKAANGLSFTATTGAAGSFSVDALSVGSGATSITAGTTAAIGTVTAGGDYTVVAGGDVTLGKAANQKQVAAGAVSITSTSGSINEGGSGLTLTSDSAGTGGKALTLKAGAAIGLANATLNGGPDKQSTVSLTSATDTTVKSVNAAAFTATARDFTSSGSIVAAGNAVVTATRDASINAIETIGAGHDLTVLAGSALIGSAKSADDYIVTASGAGGVTLGKTVGQAHTAAGAITITATGGAIARGASATSLTLTSNSDGAGVGDMLLDANGAIVLSGATLNGGPAQQSAVGLKAGTDIAFNNANSAAFTAMAGGDFTSTGNILAAGASDITAGGAATINRIETSGAGHGITVTASSAGIGRVVSAGDYTLTTAGVSTLGNGVNQTQAAAGKFTVDAGSIVQGATGLTLTSDSDGSGNDPLALKATGAIALANTTLNGGADKQSAVSLSSGTSTAIKAANGLSFTATTGATGSFSADALAVGGGATSITAGTTAAIGTVTAGGDYTVVAGGDVTLGKAANQKQVAAGAVSITSTSGSINEGGSGLTLTSDSAGTGGKALTLRAGAAIGLANATLNGGPDKQSAVSLDSVTNTAIKAANGLSFTAKTGATGSFSADALAVGSGATSITAGTTAAIGTVTAGGDYTVVAGGDVTLGKAANQKQVAAGAVSITSTSGSINEGGSGLTLTSDSAGTGGKALTLKAGAAIGLANATLNGGPDKQSAVSLDSVTNTAIKAANGLSFTATTGATGSFSADALAVGSGATSITAGTTAAIGTVTAGGDYTVVAGGDVTLGKAANQKQVAAGAVSITSTGGSIREGANGIVVTSDSSGIGGKALAIKAAGAIAMGDATLNGGPAKQSAITLDSGTTTAIGAANGQAFTAVARAPSATFAGKTFTVNRMISSATDIDLAVTGSVALVQGATATNAVRIAATDATVGGDIAARTIDITNFGTGNLVLGGTAESVSGKFALDRTEVARLKASETLTLGADGSDNVEIGQVDFVVPKTVRVLATGKRIDITGRISFGGSTTTLKLGTDNAATSIITLAAGNGGTGGSITSNGGVLELSAANIVAGSTAFAGELDAVTGTGSIDAASRLNLTPGSTLYSNPGGSGDPMINVGSMKITFSGFAMFQNTSDVSRSLLATGVNLGNGDPMAIALDIANGSSQPVFALFGSINGVVNAATALLGNPPLAHYDNISASRINGCVIGGGNCQSVQNLTPSLTALDNIRTSIFTVKPDFQVPFDPLIGTNNDALFDDVGSFGLGELPMTPIECSDPNGSCDAQKKDAK